MEKKICKKCGVVLEKRNIRMFNGKPCMKKCKHCIGHARHCVIPKAKEQEGKCVRCGVTLESRNFYVEKGKPNKTTCLHCRCGNKFCKIPVTPGEEGKCRGCGVILEERNRRIHKDGTRVLVCKHCSAGAKKCRLTWKDPKVKEYVDAQAYKIEAKLFLLRFPVDNKKLYAGNREYYKNAAAQWRKRNPEIAKEASKRYYQKSQAILSDTFVKRYLINHNAGFSFKDIPQELVELKRSHMKLKRLIKKKTH